LVSEIEPYFDSYEVLVVNDGSTDGTRQVLAGYSHPHVRVVTVASNRGKGHGVREGFRLAQGDAVLFIDGGMELHPSAIRVFLGLLELYGADIVIGSKRHPQSRVDYPALRRVLSFIYQKLIKILFRLDVTDTQVGIKLFRRQVVDAILPELRIDRYGFDLELLALARRKGFGKILEAPIRLDYFSRNSRPLPLELLHIVRVGTAILRDTFALYFRLWGTPGRPRGAVVSAPAGPEREDRVQTPEAEEKTG
jgi:glycosyltransferase involved in cell wall biosynthesis